MPKIVLPGSYKFLRVLFDRGSSWRKRGWNSSMGISRTCPCTHRPEREQELCPTTCPFFGAATEFLRCVCWQTFYKQGPVRYWICTCLILKDGAVPAIKDPGHDSELQTVSETASNVCVLLEICAQVLVAPPTAHLQELGFFSERIVKLYLSFINMIKLNMNFWRYEGCNTTLWVLKINTIGWNCMCYAAFK